MFKKLIAFLLVLCMLPIVPVFAEDKVTSQLITTFDSGFSKDGKNWATGTMANSLGDTTKGASLYSATVGDYVKYTPSNLKPGWYDIYFWNIKYQSNQDPMKMTGTVYSNGELTENIVLGVSTATTDRQGAWTKVGTYYFAGTNDEYFKMTVNVNAQFARPSDVKFELNENYVPEKVTSQLITTFDKGFSKEGKNWTEATMANSLGSTTKGASLYSGVEGDYTQYTPSNLKPGWYDIYFWNIKYETSQNPIKMTGTVYSNKETISGITLPVNTVSADRGGIWSKVGTYYFAGTDDEYFRLVATGGAHARPSDVKFELNESYTPEKKTYQRISTTSSGFSVSGSWLDATMPDSTGDTTKGASKYCAAKGSYAQYTPENLKPGWYDVSFWNIKYQNHQNPMKMAATVYSNQETVSGITLPVNTETADRAGIWSKVGTYYFSGTNDEYLRLVIITGGDMSRVADVKFELNENYVPPKVTYNRISTTSSGFEQHGDWIDASMPDSTGNSTKGASKYSFTAGDYAKYTPGNLEPGWYDVSFWNIRYQNHQDPIKMTGTVYANGKTKSGIKLPVNRETEDRAGIWSKVGTYYFAGTDDEYFMLVATGGANARAADVKFEKNDNFVPPPTFGNSEISVSGTDSFYAVSKKGNYDVYINKVKGWTDGRIDVTVDDKVIDSRYMNYMAKGKQLVGTYNFADDADVKLVFVPMSDNAESPIDTVYFAPASKISAVYTLYNMQKEEQTFFFAAGNHKVVADVTNGSDEEKGFQMVCAVYENGDLVKTGVGERVTVPKGETAQISAEIGINNATKNTEFKVYIWDGVHNMIPVLPGKTYQKQDTRIFGGFTLTPYSFSNLGTWKKTGNTSAFTDMVLLGTTSGNGAASTPASISFNAAEDEYRIWVRTVNYTDRPDSRYFNVSLNGKNLEKTFGQVGQDGLFWEDGGVVELDGETVLSLVDSSGFYAKVDSIIVTDDLDYVPTDDFDQVKSHAPIFEEHITSLSDEEMMSDFVMDKNFPGGNYIFHSKAKNVVNISTDCSDRGKDGWFYWNFKATSGSDRTVTYKISGCEQVIGSSGVVYSTDDGKTWSYLTESAQKPEFTYDMKAGETVHFAVTLPYQLEDLTDYLGTLNSNRVNVSVLCKSEEGRDVPLVTIGNTSAPKAVVMTSRHHCCEATPSYEFEGIMDYLAYDAPASLFEDYCFYFVPMMDVDGVENGDQGKERSPHDHNRDYEKDRYNSVRSLKALAATLDIEFFLDLHCPMLQASKPYLYYSDEDADVVAEFSRILAETTAESKHEKPIIFDGSRDYDSGPHFAACSRGYFFLKAGSPFSTTLEFPYSGVVGNEYTIDRMYDFGTSVIKAVEKYLTK